MMIMRMSRSIRAWAGLGGALVVLALPAAASADTSTSQNWSGYAVHQTGLTFRKVSGTWRQPQATCSQGQQTYSAFWVGLGGFSLTSTGLEQIGTEVDCTASGSPQLYAWYELVPATSQPVRMTIRAGDQLSATVEVLGSKVTLTLADRTSHASFTKTLSDRTIDVTSAEWIAEAPSACLGNTRCRTLPLADFGSLQFTGAAVQTAGGRTGVISSPLWTTTKILLTSSASRFVSYGTSANAGNAQSTPSALTSAGTAFAVTYSLASQLPSNPGSGGGGIAPPSSTSRGVIRGAAASVSRRERLVQGVRAGAR